MHVCSLAVVCTCSRLGPSKLATAMLTSICNVTHTHTHIRAPAHSHKQTTQRNTHHGCNTKVVSSNGLPGPEALLWRSPATFNTDDFDTGVLVATLQGIVNRNVSTFDGTSGGPPALFVDSTNLFNDWDGADVYWASYLARDKGVRFTNISGSGLDGLLEAAGWAAQGVVL